VKPLVVTLALILVMLSAAPVAAEEEDLYIDLGALIHAASEGWLVLPYVVTLVPGEKRHLEVTYEVEGLPAVRLDTNHPDVAGWVSRIARWGAIVTLINIGDTPITTTAIVLVRGSR
jgi:hypothetical protein